MKRWNWLAAAAAIAASLFITSPNWAAPINYDESVSGDVDGHRFVLDVGTNTVVGRNRFVTLLDNGRLLGFDIDADQFSIDIQATDVLVSASVVATFEDITGNTSFVALTWLLSDMGRGGFSSTRYGLVGDVTLPPGGGALWSLPLATGSFFLPVASGSYFVNAPGAGGWSPRNASDSYGGDILYTLSFDVVRIAEPATVVVIAFALAGLVASRRRER